MGYKDFYLSLLINLGCLDDISLDKRLISTGIARINETRNQNKHIKAQPSTKRRRRYGLLAKTKQQIYEERVDRATKMGTYRTGIAIDSIDAEETNNNRQSSNTSSKRVCPRCGKKGHLTYRSKKCLHHNEYIMTKKNQSISSSASQTNKSSTLTTNNENQIEKNIFGGGLQFCTFIENEKNKICKNEIIMDFGTETFDATTQVASLDTGSNAQFSTLQNTVVSKSMVDISDAQEALLENTPVHEKVQNFESTGLGSTDHSKKRKLDSITDNIGDVEDNVGDYFDIDETSEIYSLTSSENSVDTQILD